MGLDMYAQTIPAALIGDHQVDITITKEMRPSMVDIAYWRKFNHLHGWMERLYREKGGQGEDFNCDTVRLTPEDIDRLEADSRGNKLKHTPGFFFGGEEIYPEDAEPLKEFIQDARNAFSQEKAVFYYSFW